MVFGSALSRAAAPPPSETGRVLYVKYAAGLRGMPVEVSDAIAPVSSLVTVLVTVTSCSLQDVRDRFPEPEKQLVRVDIMTIVHSAG